MIPTEWRAPSEGPSVVAALGDMLSALREWRRSVVIERTVLMERVIELVEKPELRERVGRAARERVCAKFSEEKVREATVEAWEALRLECHAGDCDVEGIQSPLEVDANMFAHYATRSEQGSGRTRQGSVRAERQA